MRAAILAFAGVLWTAVQLTPLLLRPTADEFTRPAPALCVVRLETTKGTVDIEVTRAWAPRGADRFVNLVRAGYYDGNRIFRLNPGRWVQFQGAARPARSRARTRR